MILWLLEHLSNWCWNTKKQTRCFKMKKGEISGIVDITDTVKRVNEVQITKTFYLPAECILRATKFERLHGFTREDGHFCVFSRFVLKTELSCNDPDLFPDTCPLLKGIRLKCPATCL